MGLQRTDFEIFLNRQTVEVLSAIFTVLEQIRDGQDVLNQRLDRTLSILVSAGLNSAPGTTVGITVGTTYVELFRNDTAPSMTVNIANLDPAQPLWVGLQTVSTSNGRIINPRDNANFVLPLGTALYGITDIGTIQAVMSILTNLHETLSASGEGGAR